MVKTSHGKSAPTPSRMHSTKKNARAEVFLAEQFCPTVQAEFSRELGCEANIYIDEKDKQTVIFAYPHLFTNPATLQVIRLEIGALAAWTPAKIAQIEPYAATYYPKVFSQKDTAILTVARSGPSGKRRRSCTMKLTDPKVRKCRSVIPGITMTYIGCL